MPPFPTGFITAALPFIAVGFIAQCIDIALGMAYGISSTTLLLSLGIPPVTASASTHLGEVFTTAVSGFTHWRAENFHRPLMLRLIIPGVLGGVVGAYLLNCSPPDLIRPYIALIQAWIGILILISGWRNRPHRYRRNPPLAPLTLFGGFFDAVGGGGWGPIVASTLIARGQSPRTTIGSVTIAEFFVTFAESVAFLVVIGISHTHVILGLILGSVLAAPFRSSLTKNAPRRMLSFLTGVAIIALSLRTFLLAR